MKRLEGATVTISLRSAQYLATVVGHGTWGNPKRRAAAAEELGAAISEVFKQLPTEDHHLLMHGWSLDNFSAKR